MADTNSDYQDLRIGSIFIILVGGAVGVFPPIIGRLTPKTMDSIWFNSFKAFGGGVIVTTGFVHLLGDAFSDLNAVSQFPIAPAVCLGSAMLMLVFEQLVLAYMMSHMVSPAGSTVQLATKSDSESKNALPNVTNSSEAITTAPVDEQGSENGSAPESGFGHTHSHPMLMIDEYKYGTPKARMIASVLEFGIIVHSVIIGIDLGVTTDFPTLRALIIAITFHQMFEGVGLGATIAVAQISWLRGVIYSIAFSLTTPLGIAIGIATTTAYDGNSNNANWIKGILNAAASGILIYAGLVNMLVEDFHRCSRSRPLKKAFLVFFMFLGYGIMTLIANWA